MLSDHSTETERDHLSMSLFSLKPSTSEHPAGILESLGSAPGLEDPRI